MDERVLAHFKESIAVKQASAGLANRIAAAAKLMADTLQRGGKILSCGNGGSAADAQHFSSELIGRFERERRPLAAVALTTDTSALTALSNDYDFAAIFARQGTRARTRRRYIARDLHVGKFRKRATGRQRSARTRHCRSRVDRKRRGHHRARSARARHRNSSACGPHLPDTGSARARHPLPLRCDRRGVARRRLSRLPRAYLTTFSFGRLVESSGSSGPSLGGSGSSSEKIIPWPVSRA